MGERLESMGGEANRDEEHDPLEEGLIKLTWMSRQLCRVVREDHGPRHVRRTPIKFAIDEIGEPPEAEAYRGCGGAEIEQPVESGADLPGIKKESDDDPQKTAVKRHPAIPQSDHRNGISEEMAQIVEQDIADPAPEDDAKCDPDEDIIDLLGRCGRRLAVPECRIANQSAHIPDGEGNARNVGNCIPTHDERPDRESDRVDIRESDERQQLHCDRKVATTSQLVKQGGRPALAYAGVGS